MSELLSVIYDGPSGCLLAEGHEAPKGVIVEWPADVVERVNEHTDHKLRLAKVEDDTPEKARRSKKSAPETAAALVAGSVASPSVDARLSEEVPPPSE